MVSYPVISPLRRRGNDLARVAAHFKKHGAIAARQEATTMWQAQLTRLPAGVGRLGKVAAIASAIRSAR